MEGNNPHESRSTAAARREREMERKKNRERERDRERESQSRRDCVREEKVANSKTFELLLSPTRPRSGIRGVVRYTSISKYSTFRASHSPGRELFGKVEKGTVSVQS